MNKAVSTILITFIVLWVMKGCLTPSPRQYRTDTNTNVTVNVTSEARDGLDLQALIELVKKGRSAEDIEKKLNTSGSINNLDLNEDGEVDFIKVTEFGNKGDTYGFAFTVEVAEGEEQEIAEIEVSKEGESAEIVARGNHQVYGHNHYYHSRSLLTDLMIWHYLVTPHSYYYSHWRWGYYPTYYSTYRPVSRSVYQTRTRSYTRNSNVSKLSSSSPKSKSSLSNPKRGKTANSGIKQNLAKPTTTQKQFQTRSKTKTTSSGGFGKSSSRKSTSSSSTRSTTASSSRKSTSTSSSRKSSSSYNSRSYSRSRSYGGSGK